MLFHIMCLFHVEVGWKEREQDCGRRRSEVKQFHIVRHVRCQWNFDLQPVSYRSLVFFSTDSVMEKAQM